MKTSEQNNGRVLNFLLQIYRKKLLFFVKNRVVTKISSCWVKTTSRRGIKQLGISFVSSFLLFSNKSSRGKISGPCLLMTALNNLLGNIFCESFLRLLLEVKGLRKNSFYVQQVFRERACTHLSNRQSMQMPVCDQVIKCLG